jgi:hypothetical protein
MGDPSKCMILFQIKGLDDLEPNLAKVEVASSSLVSRSKNSLLSTICGGVQSKRRGLLVWDLRAVIWTRYRKRMRCRDCKGVYDPPLQVANASLT